MSGLRALRVHTGSVSSSACHICCQQFIWNWVQHQHWQLWTFYGLWSSVNSGPEQRTCCSHVLRGWTVRASKPGGGQDILSSVPRPDRLYCQPSFCWMCIECLYRRVKWLGREVKNERSYISMAWARQHVLSYRNKPGLLQLAEDEINCWTVVTTVMNRWGL